MPPKKVEEATTTGAARFGRVKNNLKCGVVGLPNVGKSSLFNLLTEQAVAAENFPFCTIEPNEARCAVPDERYDFLCNLWEPPSKYPAYLWLTDIAGLVRGAAEGAGLGNAFLSHIQYLCTQQFPSCPNVATTLNCRLWMVSFTWFGRLTIQVLGHALFCWILLFSHDDDNA
eukprot:6422010-Pyramimonas_sp.AAC.2